MTKLLLFILQVYKVIKIKELREEEEDVVKDEDQTEDQTEDQIGDQPEDQIGEQREDPTEDEDSIEDQEEDQTVDMALAKEVVEEHTLIPKASMKADRNTHTEKHTQ